MEHWWNDPSPWALGPDPAIPLILASLGVFMVLAGRINGASVRTSWGLGAVFALAGVLWQIEPRVFVNPVTGWTLWLFSTVLLVVLMSAALGVGWWLVRRWERGHTPGAVAAAGTPVDPAPLVLPAVLVLPKGVTPLRPRHPVVDEAAARVRVLRAG